MTKKPTGPQPKPDKVKCLACHAEVWPGQLDESTGLCSVCASKPLRRPVKSASLYA